MRGKENHLSSVAEMKAVNIWYLNFHTDKSMDHHTFLLDAATNKTSHLQFEINISLFNSYVAVTREWHSIKHQVHNSSLAKTLFCFKSSNPTYEYSPTLTSFSGPFHLFYVRLQYWYFPLVSAHFGSCRHLTTLFTGKCRCIYGSQYS